MSEEAKDLVTKLLCRNHKERIGSKGDMEEVLAHPFFAGIDREKILKREIIAEYRPIVTSEDL